jgi:serine kinase of HPr protein (carbohydrate metabolism regulator)
MSPPAIKSVTLHGVFIQIFDVGVLLAGGSGVGKSELALELLARGHRLIADDAAEFIESGSEGKPRIEGRCPPLLRGFLEVRGLGILNIERMFGSAALLERCPLDLILRLLLPTEVTEMPDRVFGQRRTRAVLDVGVPEIALPIRLGHNLAALAEAACRDQQLKRSGYDAAADFVARQRRAIDEYADSIKLDGAQRMKRPE